MVMRYPYYKNRIIEADLVQRVLEDQTGNEEKQVNRLMKQAALLAVILLVVAIAVPMSAPQPASAQNNTYTITVTGVGTAAGAPDVASVELGVETINTSLANAFEQTSSTLTAINDAILGANVAAADIQTGTMTIAPEDRIDPQTGGQTGEYVYRVRSTLVVTLRDMNTVQQIIGAAVNAGANVVQNLNLGIVSPDGLETSARAAAIENARARATELAQAFGVSVGDPIVITETVTTSALPTVPTTNPRGSLVQDAELPQNAGQMIVTVQVQVTFNLRPIS
jgi:uncharacterized protein